MRANIYSQSLLCLSLALVLFTPNVNDSEPATQNCEPARRLVFNMINTDHSTRSSNRHGFPAWLDWRQKNLHLYPDVDRRTRRRSNVCTPAAYISRDSFTS